MKATEWMSQQESDAKKIRVQTSLPADPTLVDASQFDQHLTDIKAALGSLKSPTEREIVVTSRRPQSAVLSYGAQKSTSGRSGDFRPPFHDYSEIARAIDTESFLSSSIKKHREYVLKEGFMPTGSNPETVEYIRRRMFLFALATGITEEEWVRELVTNLVSFSSSFIVKKRDRDKSVGRSIRLHGKKLDPIAGLFPLDPVSVKVKQNLSGRPLRWRQEIDGRTRTFDAADVINITMDRKSGFVFGTPYSITVLDDIRALRRLEELVEMVAHKHLFPLFHVKVGTEKKPAQDVETASGYLISEVDMAKGQIEAMPSEGGLVTSERYEIELLGSEGKVLDLMPYITHFKERVMSGLRLSPLDLGQADTGNKATAQVVNRNLVDAVKDFQRVISDQITFQLFDELLLEGGFDLNLENRVYFSFPTADREEERSSEQHGLTLFQSNGITCEEYRQDYLKRECFTPEQEKDTWHERYEKPMFEAQLAQKAAQSAASSSDSKGKEGSQKKANDNKARPTNQSGKSPSKPRFPMNDTSEKILREWESTTRDAINGISISDGINVFRAKAESLLRMAMIEEFKVGATDMNMESADQIIVPISLAQTYIAKTLTSALNNSIASTIIMAGNTDGDQTSVRSAFEISNATLKNTIDRLLKSARRYGFMRATQLTGRDEINAYDESGRLVDIVSVSASNAVDRLVDCYSIGVRELKDD